MACLIAIPNASARRPTTRARCGDLVPEGGGRSEVLRSTRHTTVCRAQDQQGEDRPDEPHGRAHGAPLGQSHRRPQGNAVPRDRRASAPVRPGQPGVPAAAASPSPVRMNPAGPYSPSPQTHATAPAHHRRGGGLARDDGAPGTPPDAAARDRRSTICRRPPRRRRRPTSGSASTRASTRSATPIAPSRARPTAGATPTSRASHSRCWARRSRSRPRWSPRPTGARAAPLPLLARLAGGDVLRQRGERRQASQRPLRHRRQDAGPRAAARAPIELPRRSARASRRRTGARHGARARVFSPLTLRPERVRTVVEGDDTIDGRTALRLREEHQGLAARVWLDADGRVLREEAARLHAARRAPATALAGVDAAAPVDLALATHIPLAGTIARPARRARRSRCA